MEFYNAIYNACTKNQLIDYIVSVIIIEYLL